MTDLFNRNILLGVSGGIAAYKSAELVRKLQELGAEVRVIMTRGAQEFITPLTLQALSGNPVYTELLDEEAERGMGHIELAKWADAIVLAPATADLVARLAAGRADDLLTTVVLATAAPVLVAPAMNQQMWADTATQDNIKKLDAREDIHRVGPAAGEQACGDVGFGRLAEPDVIAAATADLFEGGSLQGLHVCITAGPTREALDPVRYISNHSSGKMGFALATAAADAGARVTLISGPVNLATPPRVERVDIVSARDMLAASEAALPGCDIFIACAAVADYRPADEQPQKIKKGPEETSLALVRNPDIVATVAAVANAPFTVGFAAETQDVLTYARDKLARKGLNMIIANDVATSEGGFNSDSNAVTVIWNGGEAHLPLATKTAIANGVIEHISRLFRENL